MTATAWIGLGVALAAVASALAYFRDRIAVWARTPPVLGKGHVAALFVLSLVGSILAMGVGVLAREQYSRQEERARITRGEVRAIARRVSKPTAQELAMGLRQFYETCSPATDTREARECRRQIVRTITRVLRVENARIVPTRDTSRTPARTTAVRPRTTTVIRPPAPRPPTVTPPSSTSDPRVTTLADEVAQLQRDVQVLKDRKPLDSTALDNVENRLRDVEALLGGLGARVDGLMGGLCRSALGRALAGIGLCR